MSLNLPLSYFVLTKEYGQTSPKKRKKEKKYFWMCGRTFLNCLAFELNVCKTKQLKNVLGRVVYDRKATFKTPPLLITLHFNNFQTFFIDGSL